MGTYGRNLQNGVRLVFITLVVIKCLAASPLPFSFLGQTIPRRYARQLIDPYWLNPCGTPSTGARSQELNTIEQVVDTGSGSLKHHFQAIRNYAEALSKLIVNLKVKKEGGDPYLHHQIHLFELANFPRPPHFRDFVAVNPNPLSALQETYKLLQYAAIHLSSTESDENMFEGKFTDDMDDIQRGPNGLQLIMCSVRLAMSQAGEIPDRSVEQKLKEIDVSSIRDSSRRNLRDILRLDGTAKILKFIHELFSDLHTRAA